MKKVTTRTVAEKTVVVLDSHAIVDLPKILNTSGSHMPTAWGVYTKLRREWPAYRGPGCGLSNPGWSACRWPEQLPGLLDDLQLRSKNCHGMALNRTLALHTVLSVYNLGPPNTTFSQNNGVIAITRCASRAAGIACCFWLILLGCFQSHGTPIYCSNALSIYYMAPAMSLCSCVPAEEVWSCHSLDPGCCLGRYDYLLVCKRVGLWSKHRWWPPQLAML